MGCVVANIQCRRVDTPPGVYAERELVEVDIQCQRVDAPITVTSGIVCEIAIIDMRYQRYKTRSGKIYKTKSGKILRVLKKR